MPFYPGEALKLALTSRTVNFAVEKNAVGTHDLFIVKGQCEIFFTPKIKSTLTGAAAATMSLGVTDNVAAVYAASGLATFVGPKMWMATNSAFRWALPNGSGLFQPFGFSPFFGVFQIMMYETRLVHQILLGALTGGLIEYDLYWFPRSKGASVDVA